MKVFVQILILAQNVWLLPDILQTSEKQSCLQFKLCMSLQVLWTKYIKASKLASLVDLQWFIFIKNKYWVIG